MKAGFAKSEIDILSRDDFISEYVAHIRVTVQVNLVRLLQRALSLTLQHHLYSLT